MQNNGPYPFYYPTSVAIIDDNTDFLINFSLQLDERLAYTLHPLPSEALALLNNSQGEKSDVRQLISTHTDIIDDEFMDNIIVLDTSQIINELKNPNRFMEHSVVIVDYDMPQMNGVELCQAIENRNIKKILLTGVADESVAIKAFNDGIIDKFIKKSDMDAIEQINHHIVRFQHEYFQAKTSLIRQTLNTKVYGFLQQPEFIRLFNNIVAQYQICEYYLTNSPTGYLLISADSKTYQLIVQSDVDLDSHAEIISDQEGTEELYKLVKDKKVIPYFWETDGFYHPKLNDWERLIYPAKQLSEDSKYYYTIVESPGSHKDLAKNIYSYGSYLKSLDEHSLHHPIG